VHSLLAAGRFVKGFLDVSSSLDLLDFRRWCSAVAAVETEVGSWL
jgi:hypothetical protein